MADNWRVCTDAPPSFSNSCRDRHAERPHEAGTWGNGKLLLPIAWPILWSHLQNKTSFFRNFSPPPRGWPTALSQSFNGVGGRTFITSRRPVLARSIPPSRNVRLIAFKLAATGTRRSVTQNRPVVSLFASARGVAATSENAPVNPPAPANGTGAAEKC